MKRRWLCEYAHDGIVFHLCVYDADGVLIVTRCRRWLRRFADTEWAWSAACEFADYLNQKE